MSLSFSPSPSSHLAVVEEQAAGPSCCDSLEGVTVSEGKECSAGRVDAVPFLCYSLVGAPHRFCLMVRCLAPMLSRPVGHLICVPGGSSNSCLVWGDSYYLDFLVHLSFVCLTELCKAWGMSRALCLWKCVVFWNCS